MSSISNLIRSGNVEVEKEYVFWCKVTEDTLSALMRTDGYIFLDLFLKRNGDKTRIRVKKDSATVTKKVKNGDEGNIEYNEEVKVQVAMVMAPYAENIHRVRRCEIPITNEGRPILRKSSGEPLKWEIDVFFNSRQGNSALPWVKVELEVDSFTSDRLIELIPFNYTDVIDEGNKKPQDNALITDIWERLSNLSNNK